MVIPGRRTVLIVDDEPSVRETLERLLKSNGYEPTVAANGHEALAHALSQEFEVVLLDIRMPGLSGIDVLQRLLADHPDTGIIMVTAVVDTKTAVDAMKMGAYDYVLKPFDLDDILVRVQKARERRFLAIQVKNHQKDIEERLLEREKELRAMTIQMVQALITEETLTRGADSKKGKEKKPRQGTDIRGTDIREFGAKIMRRLYGDVASP